MADPIVAPAPEPISPLDILRQRSVPAGFHEGMDYPFAPEPLDIPVIPKARSIYDPVFPTRQDMKDLADPDAAAHYLFDPSWAIKTGLEARREPPDPTFNIDEHLIKWWQHNGDDASYRLLDILQAAPGLLESQSANEFNMRMRNFMREMMAERTFATLPLLEQFGKGFYAGGVNLPSALLMFMPMLKIAKGGAAAWRIGRSGKSVREGLRPFGANLLNIGAASAVYEAPLAATRALYQEGMTATDAMIESGLAGLFGATLYGVAGAGLYGAGRAVGARGQARIDDLAAEQVVEAAADAGPLEQASAAAARAIHPDETAPTIHEPDVVIDRDLDHLRALGPDDADQARLDDAVTEYVQGNKDIRSEPIEVPARAQGVQAGTGDLPPAPTFEEVVETAGHEIKNVGRGLISYANRRLFGSNEAKYPKGTGDEVWNKWSKLRKESDKHFQAWTEAQDAYIRFVARGGLPEGLREIPNVKSPQMIEAFKLIDSPEWRGKEKSVLLIRELIDILIDDPLGRVVFSLRGKDKNFIEVAEKFQEEGGVMRIADDPFERGSAKIWEFKLGDFRATTDTFKKGSKIVYHTPYGKLAPDSDVLPKPSDLKLVDNKSMTLTKKDGSPSHARVMATLRYLQANHENSVARKAARQLSDDPPADVMGSEARGDLDEVIDMAIEGDRIELTVNGDKKAAITRADLGDETFDELVGQWEAAGTDGDRLAIKEALVHLVRQFPCPTK